VGDIKSYVILRHPLPDAVDKVNGALSSFLRAAVREERHLKIAVAAPRAPDDIYIAVNLIQLDCTQTSLIGQLLSHPPAEGSACPCEPRDIRCVLYKATKGRSGKGAGEEGTVIFRVAFERGIEMVQAMFS
jgi:hypothetical protein